MRPYYRSCSSSTGTSVRARMVGTASAPRAEIPKEIIEAPTPSAMRSPADVLRALIAALTLLVVVIVQWIFGDSIVGFAVDLFRGLDALPTWLTTTLSVALRVLAIVFLLGGFIAALLHGRWRLLLSAHARGPIAGALLFLLVDAIGAERRARGHRDQRRGRPLTDRRLSDRRWPRGDRGDRCGDRAVARPQHAACGLDTGVGADRRSVRCWRRSDSTRRPRRCRGGSRAR